MTLNGINQQMRVTYGPQSTHRHIQSKQLPELLTFKLKIVIAALGAHTKETDEHMNGWTIGPARPVM